jgi:uncharacterized membrane protein YoaK (UPF0700 family)
MNPGEALSFTETLNPVLNRFSLLHGAILFTLSISFVATLQNSMFPKIEKETINTVMTTGNLRSLFQTLTRLAFSHPRSDAASKIRIFGTVGCSFLLGALFGGVISPLAHNRSLWIPSAFLLFVCATLLLAVAPPKKWSS